MQHVVQHYRYVGVVEVAAHIAVQGVAAQLYLFALTAAFCVEADVTHMYWPESGVCEFGHTRQAIQCVTLGA